MIKARDTMESLEVKLTTLLASREFYGCWPVEKDDQHCIGRPVSMAPMAIVECQ